MAPISPVLEQSRNHDQHPGRGQRRCDEFEVAEEILDLSVRHTAERSLLDDLYDGFADDCRERRRDDDQCGRFSESRCALEIGAAPLRPEIHDDGKHRAGVEHDQEQCHGGRRRIQTQQLLGYDHMRRTRHRQQFRQSLHHGKNDDFQQ